MTTEFIDDPRFYASFKEYHEAKCKWMTLSMESERIELQKERERFRPQDLMKFKQVLATAIVPVDLSREMRYKTALFSQEKDMETWLDEHRHDTPEAQRVYVDEVIAQKEVFVAQKISDDLAQAQQWFKETYLPRNDFMLPLTAKEAEYIASNIDAANARLISQGEIQACGCIAWQGPLQSTQKWAYIERRRQNNQTEKKKRITGKVQELLYNFLREPLRLKQRCTRTCETVNCVNPYHVEIKIKGNRKRKRSLEL